MLVKFVIFSIVWLIFSGECFATSYGVKLSNSEKLIALTNHFVNKRLVVKKPLFPSKPIKPKIPKSEKLTKGKYEKTVTFDARVESARVNRAKKIKQIEDSYAKKVKNYNAQMKRLTDTYNNNVAYLKKKIDSITLEEMQKAYSKVYGKPYLEDSLKYDADSEIFYGTIKSTKGDFNEKISFKIPINKAENFERNIKYVKPKLEFKYENSKLFIERISLDRDNSSYIATLNDVNYKSENISVAINNGNLNLPAVPLLNSSLMVDASEYDVGEINYSKDPEIAKLQKQKFALERKQKLKQQSKRKKEELAKQREALESQIALLEQKSGGVDDIGLLLKDSSSAKVDAKKWLFIVAIENYEYTNPVAYSANSAKEFKKVMKKRLGIPEKNIRTLINKGATSGKIRYKFKDMLARVKKGDTIYFYYSGHGIPVPSQKIAPIYSHKICHQSM